MSPITMDRPTLRVQQAAEIIQQLTPQEISQLLELVPSLQPSALPKQVRYEINEDEMRQYVLKELAALGNEYRPMRPDDPFVGGKTVGEFFDLSEDEQARLWAEQHQMDIDDFEEYDVQPGAQLPA